MHLRIEPGVIVVAVKEAAVRHTHGAFIQLFGETRQVSEDVV